MSNQEEERLDSWKEIAAFLGRDLRTVRRWELRGLPVYRVPGAKHRVVFAYCSEISAWLQQQSSTPSSSRHIPEIGAAGLPSEDGNNTTALVDQDTGSTSEHLTPRGLHSGTPILLRRNGTLVWIICAMIVLLGIAAYAILRPANLLTRAFPRQRTHIARVSPIRAVKSQGIIIEGEGFGPPPKLILKVSQEGGVDTYGENYSTSIRIDNLGNGRHRWVAGRAGPLNDCDVSLRLVSWTDSRIVLAGFAGPVGPACTDEYQIAPGDQLKITVWGPQNRCGPAAPSECLDELKEGKVATFDTFVLPLSGAQPSSCR